jgi:hypothetical protein
MSRMREIAASRDREIQALAAKAEPAQVTDETVPRPKIA